MHIARLESHSFPDIPNPLWTYPPFLDMPTHGHDLVPEIPPRKDMRPEIPTHPRGQTDTCENMTFPKLRWWAVVSKYSEMYKV